MKYLTGAIQFIATNQGDEDAIADHLVATLHKMDKQINSLQSQRRLLQEMISYATSLKLLEEQETQP